MNTIHSLIIASVALMGSTAVQAKSPLTISDLYKVQGVSGVSISPDGTRLAYNHSRSDLAKHKSYTTVTVVDLRRVGSDGTIPANATHQLTEEGKSSSPMWSRNSRTLYYMATDTAGKSQLFGKDLSSGKVTQVTNYALGVTAPVISSDENLVAFTAEVYPDLGGADPEANLRRITSKNEGPVQAHIADELLYRHWDSYRDGRYNHVIVFDRRKGTYTDLTPGKFDSPIFMLGGGVGYAFSPDGKELCFVSNRTDRPAENTNADLFTVPTTGGEPTCLTADNPAWDGSPAYSPDGRYIAYRLQRVPGHESDRFRLALIDRKTGAKRTLTEAYDNWVEDFTWMPDSRTIYFRTQERGYSPVYKLTLDGDNFVNVLPDRTVYSFDIAPDGYFYYTYSTIGKPIALYRSRDGKQEQQLTHYNEQLEASVDIRPGETMWVQGADSAMIQLWIVKPHNFDPNKKYPLIINVHGGPQMQWTDSFRGDWQVYPGAGYIVAFPNPHGSTGYGQEFTTSISGDWGGKPYEDVLRVTEALAKLPYVDSTRMGAMGWSYGGYFMNWLQANKHPFKCLASMMGLYDLRSMWGATEELWFPEFDLKGKPWTSDLYRKFSPSEYVNRFRTPALIITGERDYRVSYTQSLQYFSVLQSLGIPSRLIVLTNDGHWPSSLNSMPLYYNAHLEWFHRWLGGDPAPYDSRKMIDNEVTY